ncbi:hypothetical protein EDD16DRAFT_1040364 [Pisolithus croceorrhizus]|nr:hypothetical protein EDD16DRAFT_1040364 [Pisolithus croceorrhizus]KAI6130240.1 hypothetical protein EV401DRAFT_621810 [Pisolithus croceorrhizus]KAI6164485.1 hypothetical protein EDD17DRAFT_1724795 [Pisolithus thermaeus]
MAQAFFDGHPLEEYLRDSGEASEPILPGGIPEFSLRTLPPCLLPRYSERMERICYLILDVLELATSGLSSDRSSKRFQAFAERFKYGVISSTLLSTSFPSNPIQPIHRRSFSPSVPGKLASSHSRTSSLADSTCTITTDTFALSIPAEPETPLWPFTLSFTVSIAALSARLYSLSLLLFSGTLYYIRIHRLDLQSRPDVMTPSLEALQSLISAGQLWASTVNDAFNLLDNEEQSTSYGSMSLSAPLSSLRVALSSSLLTTQTQCDNVRQLLSAVACPTELSQLTEMYAPPSPMKSTFSPTAESNRPMSHPGSPQRQGVVIESRRKRSTWNGSYSALASAGSPPPIQLSRRREKRRSDLSTLLGSAPPLRGSFSAAPTSPSPLKPIVDASEDDSMLAVDSSFTSDGDETFGTAALDFQRKRQSRGLRALEVQQRGAPPSFAQAALSLRRRATMSPGSKYTSMQATRHPLSLSALHQSLLSALASKRFACSHLLALRFEDDDEMYWEDVRSVMGLLTSTLVDASTRLSEALDEVEESHLRLDDDSVTEDPPGINTPSSLGSPPRPSCKLSDTLSLNTSIPFGSFAPLPSHLTRFAAHVDTISTALNDAREHLERCVASLNEDVSPAHSPQSSTSSVGEHPTIQAYEQLRRELGLALRECERGRERLVGILAPLTPPAEDVGANDVAAEPQCPTSQPPKEEGDDVAEDDISVTVMTPDGETADVDDVTAHLLLTASAEYLPPPGIEQVYEADTSTAATSTRERSKLSREERIRLTKARREAAANGSNSLSGPGHDSDAPFPKMERWGPGGEVVQELKDVIWKVGERRRQMTENHIRSVVFNASSSLPSSPQCAIGPVSILPQNSAP